MPHMKSSLPLFALMFFVVSNALCLTLQETAREFQEGKVVKFSVLGHAKSKGTNFSIKYPQSWMAKEGDRPNTVQSFVSDHGKGLEVVSIITKAIPPEEPFSKADIPSYLSPDQVGRDIPPGAKLIRAVSTKIEAEPAAIIEYSIQQDRAGMVLESHIMALQFFQGRTFVMVSFYVGRLSEAEAARRFELCRPLFFQMINSIVFDGKWK